MPERPTDPGQASAAKNVSQVAVDGGELDDAAALAKINSALPWATDTHEPAEAVQKPPALPEAAPAASAEKTPNTTDRGFPSANAPLDHAAWLALCARLALSGLTGNLVAHTVLEQDDGRTLTLRLDPSQGAMNAEVHVQRLTQALAEQGWTRQVLIDVGPLPDGLETPVARRRRLQAEQKRRAVEALHNDPHVQLFKTQFSAHLLEDSVTLLEEGSLN